MRRLFSLFLPWIGAGKVADETCGMTSGADHFVALWLALLGPRAGQMHCDARLVATAQKQAEWLIARTPDQLQQSMHIGPGGNRANQRVRAGGYNLLDWHGDDNTVECVCGGFEEAADALHSFMQSDHHRPALMGEDFWQDSVVYGVGQVGSVWVVLVCPPEQERVTNF